MLLNVTPKETLCSLSLGEAENDFESRDQGQLQG